MTIESTTLRPGILVSIKTSAKGNVTSVKKVIEARRELKDKSVRSKHETTTTIKDPKEQAALTYARSKARALVGACCTGTAFGWICTESNEEKLDAAVQEAREVARQFNRTAKYSRLGVFIVTGKIAANDVEALRAINSEVKDMMEQMAEGVKELDAKAIRKAADQARRLGSMLNKPAQERIQQAIDAARETARKIVKAGETAAIEVDRETLKTLAKSRVAFLDIDEVRSVRKTKSSARAVDFAPATPLKKAKSGRARELEMGE